jgi:hypothetical protein
MALNIGTSFQYNTNIGSQQTQMLAGQDSLAASSGATSWGGAMGAMSVIGAVGQLAGTYYSAKMANSSARYQSQMAGLQRQSMAIQSRSIQLQGKAQKLELDLKATISGINARLAETAAQTTLLTGQRQEQGQRLKTAQLKSTQRNQMAARGIDLGSDTATNILTTTDVMGEIDANTIEANAVRAAWGYRTEGVNYQIDAAMASANGNMAVANANANAAANMSGAPSTSYSRVSKGAAMTSSLLGSATNIASTYYTLNKAGAFG